MSETFTVSSGLQMLYQHYTKENIKRPKFLNFLLKGSILLCKIFGAKELLSKITFSLYRLSTDYYSDYIYSVDIVETFY